MNEPSRARAAFSATILALSLLACAACQQKVYTGQATVNMTGANGGAYSPANITVAMGTLVIFVNGDSQPHSATAAGAFDSGIVAPNGGRWTWVASIPGTFQYHSSLQPAMIATITVLPGAPTSP